VNSELAVFVLDSFAVLSYLGGESGMARVQEVLDEALQGHCRVVLSIINLGEVIYIIEREVGLAQAQAVLAAVEQLPIEILPATRESVLAAAHVKANFRVAYADAFAITAAQELGGRVLTGDSEFESVETIVQVEWLIGKV
jgi:predicted nucleic acid-binding protein